MGHVSTNTLLLASDKHVWRDTQAISVPSTYCEGCHVAVIPKAYRTHTEVRGTYDPGEVVAFDTVPNPCKSPLLKETNYPVLSD